MTSTRKKLFGTDGVRGVAGELLSAELALALGHAAAACSSVERPQALIVRDTRESGPMLEAALAAGIAQSGGDAFCAGVLPTPAASVLVRRLGLDLAVVVSASHNPWRDNGIKFFGADGRKLADELEADIEARVGGILDDPAGAGETPSVGRVRELEGALDDYLRELSSAFRFDLSGLRVVLDCANGATYRAAPAIFERLGAEIDVIAGEPDGRNINAGCGSTHPESLAERVVATGAALGFAFDGDGDRVLAVDSAGAVRDGDELIALVAAHLRGRDMLDGGVAVTVMSNYGFHQAMEAAGIEVATTPVGDRSVSAELERRGWSLGGEQSGHVIWTDFAPHRRRDRRSPAGDRGARGRGSQRRHADGAASAGPRERRGGRSGCGRVRDRRLGRGREREPGARRPRACARAPVRDRAAGPGDGRGAGAERGR